MSIDLLYLLREIAGASASRAALNDFISNRMSSLHGTLAENAVSVAREFWRWAESEQHKTNLLTTAANDYLLATRSYLSAYREQEGRFLGGNDDKKLAHLRAAISCYLCASMCFRVINQTQPAHDCMANAVQTFYDLYVDVHERRLLGEENGRMYDFSKEFSALRKLSEEEQELIRFCTLNGKVRWEPACRYSLTTKRVSSGWRNWPQESDLNIINKVGGKPPGWIR